MTGRFDPIDWTELNALVDGALDARRAAELRRQAERDPRLAAEIATLFELKQQTAGALASGVGPLPPLPEAVRKTGGWSRPGTWAAAAALVLILAAGVLLWSDGPPGAPPLAWLERAEAEHRAWLAEAPAVPAAAILPAALASEAERFDLSLAGLTLVTARSGDDGSYLGWIGDRGCRLGLWIAPAPAGLAAALTSRDRHELQLASWQVEGRGFALLATDMDPRRFEVVARLLAGRTRGEDSVAAADADSLTLPCVG